MQYREDHLKVLKLLAAAPKKTTLRITDLAAAFKGRDDADRTARNSVRKPRAEGHVEIAERGEYRLTPEGVKFMRTVEKKGYTPEPNRSAAKKVTKKGAKKVAAKKTAKKAAKASTKSAKSTKKVTKAATTSRKAAPKAAPKKAAPRATGFLSRKAKKAVDASSETPKNGVPSTPAAGPLGAALNL